MASGVDVAAGVAQPDVCSDICQHEAEALVGQVDHEIVTVADKAVLEENNWPRP